MVQKNKNPWMDRFEEITELGQGGNAKVLLVKEKVTGYEYALKCLYNKSTEKIARFNDEIKIMYENAVSIEGIIPIVESSKEQSWYTMPVAKSIIEYIQEKKIDQEAIISGVIQLADTLSKLHRKGIAHRDIKPSNIYYLNNRFCFGDFGLVEFPDNSNDFTRSDKGLGAIFTIAPEMKRDPKNSDGKKADVFSLAKTVWMFLTKDEKGFDGTYDFLDVSMNLRSKANLRTMHLVELEELLKEATDNNPNNRPTIEAFKRKLQIWIEIIHDFEKMQLSEWKFLNKYLFGENIPYASSWRRRDSILNILNIVGSMPVYNHMLLSDKGGLDFKNAVVANEEGCIYIYDTLGFCFLVKPKNLQYGGFEEKFKWNYFMLEFDKLEPILEKNRMVSSEYLVEDYPAHYVSARYEQYGVYDYDSGEKLPEGYKRVKRYLEGKFLIVLKNGPYNHITGTYDGRHGMCSNNQFRQYLEMIIDIINECAKDDISEEAILNSNVFNKNPFEAELACEEPAIRKENREKRKKAKDFISCQYKHWCFKGIYDSSSPQKNIRFYITYESGNGSILSYLANKEYLCKDGFIKTLDAKEKDQIYYIYSRQEAIKILENCSDLIKEKCLEEEHDMPEFKTYFSVGIERCGKPKHLFTKNEIKELMRNADDRVHNKLVIDEDGYPRIIQNIDEAFLYPVSHETWDAGNMYVGKYSTLSSLDEDYIFSLQGWLSYLKSNKHVHMDYMHENRDLNRLLNEIKKFY